MYFRQVVQISNDEYKNLLDKSVELYRLKSKLSLFENLEKKSKAKMTRMEEYIKEKAETIKKLQRLIKFYEKERAKQQTDSDKKNIKVINNFSSEATLMFESINSFLCKFFFILFPYT